MAQEEGRTENPWQRTGVYPANRQPFFARRPPMNLRIFSPGEIRMAQMFCTLKQAAHKLETTEAEVETLINDGVLREFRDGSNRLLKLADLAGLAVAATTAGGGRPSRTRHKDRLQPEPGNGPTEIGDFEIKLPSTAAVTLEMNPPRAATPKRSSRPTRQPASQKRALRPAAQKPAVPRRRQSPPRAVVICPTSTPPRPRTQMYEMSVRQWLWTGLLDDNPLAIFIIFGVVLLGVCALAGAAYLLLQTL